MARVVLLAGRTREDRRRHTRRLQQVDEHGRPTFLFLTATRAKADAMAEAYWARADKPAVFLPDAMPIGAWFDDLARRFGGGRVVLGQTARSLLAGATWRAVQGDAEAWGTVPDGDALREGLLALVDERRLEGPACGSWLETRPEGRDYLRFERAWRDALDRSPGWTDRPSALEALRGRLRARPLDGPLLGYLRTWRSVVVDDVLDLRSLEAAVLDAFVDAFAEAVPDGEVRLCLEVGHDCVRAEDHDYFLGEGRDEAADRASRKLRGCWGQRHAAGLAEEAIEDADPGTLDLSDRLILDDVVQPGDIGPVRVRRYSTEDAEVVAMARALRASILAGRDPAEHVVALPALQRYVPLLRDVFGAYGLPWQLGRGEDLRIAPPVSAARRVLSLAVDGVDRDGLRALVASRWLLKFKPQPNEATLDALAQRCAEGDERRRLRDALAQTAARAPAFDRVQRALVESGADGPEPLAWLDRLVLWREGELDERGARRLARQALDLWVLDELAERLRALGACDDVREVSGRFAQLLADLGVAETSESADPELGPALRANRDALRRLSELLTELSASLVAVHEAVGSGSDAPAALLRDALEDAVRRDAYRTGEPAVGVQVYGFRDVHGLDLPWLWVGGLVEGEFPTPSSVPFLLPADSPLQPRVEAGDLDRARFHSLLRNVGHGRDATLLLSAPRTVAGAEALPAAPLQDLLALRCGGGTLADVWGALQVQEEGALPEHLAERELLARPALAALHGDRLSRPDVVAEHRTLHGARRGAGFSAYEGVLGAGRPWRSTAIAWLQRRLGLREGQYDLSTTALEAWASCPQRFFFERVLGSSEPRAFTAEPDALTAGSLLHAALHRFFERRVEAVHTGRLERASLEGASPTELQAARLAMAECLDAVVDQVRQRRGGPWLEAFAQRLGSGLRGGWPGRLAIFIEQEAEPFLDLDPHWLEHEIEPLDAARRAAMLDGEPLEVRVRVRLRGRVDRADRGDGLGGAKVAVYDYKSGAAPDLQRVATGLSLQPLVYAAALAGPEGTVSGYRELPRKPSEFPRKRLLGDPEALAALQREERVPRTFFAGKRCSALAADGATWAAWLRRAARYGEQLALGVFPTTLAGPGEAHCQRCDFRRACRVDHVRNAERASDPRLPVPRVLPEPPRDTDA